MCGHSLASKMPQHVPNRDCARNLASCRRAFTTQRPTETDVGPYRAVALAQYPR